MVTDNLKGYGIVSIALHWIVAAFIVFLFVNGEMFAELGRADAARQLRLFHNSVGAIGAAFIAWRIVWRLWQGAPDKGNEHWLLNLLAVLIQWALLLAMAGAVVTGFIVVWSGGREIAVFDLFVIPSPIAASGPLHEMMEEAHEFFSHVMLPLVALHVLGALKHLVVNRDGIMKRMFVPVRTD